MTDVTLSFYAFEPGAPGVPRNSATAVFVTGLVNLLREAPDPLTVRLRWLRAGGDGVGLPGGALAGARWMAGELARMLGDRSRYLLFIYPKVPILSHVQQPLFLSAAHRAYQALGAKSRLTGQRIVVLVEDLPIEMAEGKAIAGGPRPDLPVDRIRAIERTLFHAAHRIVVPVGFVDTIRERHDLDRDRFQTFRRNIYMPDDGPEPDSAPEGVGDDEGDEDEPDHPALRDFRSGSVNFFYSGGIDASLAGNFREVLRAIRTAPAARLHVCGPGADGVRDWLEELDVPNAWHYGRLPVAAHDTLAQRCDIGLILYSTDNPYNHLTPTMKYSAYLANGLAVLSTDLRAVSANVREDGSGRALSINELTIEMLRWVTRRSLWYAYKERAETLADVVRSGAGMRAWIEEIARGE